ncbi:hypothetical protein Tco_0940830 [Tanacetum coccineum]|uniref:Uncharacterized protein n=1 Tax=Tanacetum coccineum TaxID=301880 RepID=A0ABQ5DP38_9ASTR
MPPIYDAKLAETMAKYYPDLVCKYYPDYPSYTPPPTSKPSRLKESLVSLANTMAKIELASKCLTASTANLVPISTKTTITRSGSNDHTTNHIHQPTTHDTHINPHTLCAFDDYKSLTDINKSDNTMVKLLTDTPSITKIEIMVVTHIPLSLWFDLLAKTSHKTTRLRHDIAIFHQTTIHETYGVATFINDKLAICRFTEILHRVHQYPPPMFVFLQTELKPHWELHDRRYKTMILEDKDRFQEGSIDTCMRMRMKTNVTS